MSASGPSIFEAQASWTVAHTNSPPKTLSDVIDELERIQGELLTLQRALEKLEQIESLVTPEED